MRFGDRLDEAANRAAIAFAARVKMSAIPGVVEVVPNLVSALLRYEPSVTDFSRLSSEVRLLVGNVGDELPGGVEHSVEVAFDGEDLAEVCSTLGLNSREFRARHNTNPLRVLATGFAPGFIYCGMHSDGLLIPRRSKVRPRVPAGTVLLAAGQTAITSTAIPTGWHVIGHTSFRNFDPAAPDPMRVVAGDSIRFEAA